MKYLFCISICLLSVTISAQSVSQRLQKAFQQFEKDEQLKHAISSLYVIDARTGQVVFDKNSQIGLAPASTQKIITSVTAFELLGKEYRYKTDFYSNIKNSSGRIVIVKGTGDPTLGSWRYTTANPFSFFSKLIAALQINGIDPAKTDIVVLPNKSFDVQSIPDGWIWEDMGNYYGAGPSDFNWKENQVDMILSSGDNTGSPVIIKNADSLFGMGEQVYNNLRSGKKGSGDNAYYYFGYSNTPLAPGISPFLKGTIPAGEDSFKISIAVSNPERVFESDFIKFKLSQQTTGWKAIDVETLRKEMDTMKASGSKPFYTHLSPSLDSIIYWLNKKSINLYAEALVKTIAYEKQGYGSTDSGVAIVKKFWKDKGLDQDELNIYDGSGLSPLNRVTTHAQVEILKYAKTKDWFPYFLNSLPEYNNMTMKSGTISDVKGFCGYHKAKDGKEYIFSFLVNNYSGKTSPLVGKMYKVLDVLK